MAKKNTAHRPSQSNQQFVLTKDGRKVVNTAYISSRKKSADHHPTMSTVLPSQQNNPLYEINFPVQQQHCRCVRNGDGVVQYNLHFQDFTRSFDRMVARIDGDDNVTLTSQQQLDAIVDARNDNSREGRERALGLLTDEVTTTAEKILEYADVNDIEISPVVQEYIDELGIVDNPQELTDNIDDIMTDSDNIVIPILDHLNENDGKYKKVVNGQVVDAQMTDISDMRIIKECDYLIACSYEADTTLNEMYANGELHK